MFYKATFREMLLSSSSSAGPSELGGDGTCAPPVTFSYIFFFLKKADGFYVYIFFSLASKSYYVYATVNYLSGQLNFKHHPFGVL